MKKIIVSKKRQDEGHIKYENFVGSYGALFMGIDLTAFMYTIFFLI